MGTFNLRLRFLIHLFLFFATLLTFLIFSLRNSENRIYAQEGCYSSSGFMCAAEDLSGCYGPGDLGGLFSNQNWESIDCNTGGQCAPGYDCEVTYYYNAYKCGCDTPPPPPPPPGCNEKVFTGSCGQYPCGETERRYYRTEDGTSSGKTCDAWCGPCTGGWNPNMMLRVLFVDDANHTQYYRETNFSNSCGTSVYLNNLSFTAQVDEGNGWQSPDGATRYLCEGDTPRTVIQNDSTDDVDVQVKISPSIPSNYECLRWKYKENWQNSSYDQTGTECSNIILNNVPNLDGPTLWLYLGPKCSTPNIPSINDPPACSSNATPTLTITDNGGDCYPHDALFNVLKKKFDGSYYGYRGNWEFSSLPSSGSSVSWTIPQSNSLVEGAFKWQGAVKPHGRDNGYLAYSNYSKEFAVDTTPPDPPPNVTVENDTSMCTSTIKWDVSTDSSACLSNEVKYLVKINDSSKPSPDLASCTSSNQLGCWGSATSLTKSWDIGESNADYTVYVWAKDSAGNVSLSSSKVFHMPSCSVTCSGIIASENPASPNSIQQLNVDSTNATDYDWSVINNVGRFWICSGSSCSGYVDYTTQDSFIDWHAPASENVISQIQVVARNSVSQTTCPILELNVEKPDFTISIKPAYGSGYAVSTGDNAVFNVTITPLVTPFNSAIVLSTRNTLGENTCPPGAVCYWDNARIPSSQLSAGSVTRKLFITTSNLNESYYYFNVRAKPESSALSPRYASGDFSVTCRALCNYIDYNSPVLPGSSQNLTVYASCAKRYVWTTSVGTFTDWRGYRVSALVNGSTVEWNAPEQGGVTAQVNATVYDSLNRGSTCTANIEVKSGIDVTLSPNTQEVYTGQNADYQVNISSVGGYSGTVTLSTTKCAEDNFGTDLGECYYTKGNTVKLPAYKTKTLPLVVTGSGGGAISIPPSLSPYYVQVRGTSGDRVDTSNTAELYVKDLSDYTLEVAPATVTVHPGGTAEFTVTLTPTDVFNGAVRPALDCPSYAVCTFGNNKLTRTNNITSLTINTMGNISVGSYKLNVRSDDYTHFADPDGTLNVTSAGKRCSIRASNSADMSVYARKWLNLEATQNLGSNVTYSWRSAAGFFTDTGGSAFSLSNPVWNAKTVSNYGLSGGDYQIELTVTSPTRSVTCAADAHVLNYAIWINPKEITVEKASSATTKGILSDQVPLGYDFGLPAEWGVVGYKETSPYADDGSVNTWQVDTSGLPVGLAISFSPPSCTPYCETTITASADDALAERAYYILLRTTANAGDGVLLYRSYWLTVNVVPQGASATGDVSVHVWEDNEDSQNCVQDPSAGERDLAGASVHISKLDGTEDRSGTTDRAGNVSFSNLPVGDYTIDIYKSDPLTNYEDSGGCDRSSLAVSVEEGIETHVDYALVKLPASPWFQIVRGDVHTNSSLSDNIPLLTPSENFIDPEDTGVCSARGSMIDVGRGKLDWKARGTDNTIELPEIAFSGSYDNVDKHWKKLKAGNTYQFGGGKMGSKEYEISGEGVALVRVTSDLQITKKEFTLKGGDIDKKGLVLYVEGDVTIGEKVEEIDAVIYATGTITIEGSGSRDDKQLVVNGALYAKKFDMPRDGYETDENATPTEKIMYNPIYIASGKVPRELEQIKVYWKEIK